MSDRIADPWGDRTPYEPEQTWPARVDEHLEDGVEQGDVERWVQTASVLHSNGDGYEFAVKDGRIVGVRGRAEDRVNHGRLDVKDLFGWQANASPDRLTRPLVRDGDQLVESDWDTAMGRIVDRSRALLEGPGGWGRIGFYTTGQLFLEEYYTLAVIGKAGLGTPHMDGNTRLCTATAAAALKASFGTDGQPGSYTDVDHCDALAIWGHNVAETQSVLWMRVRLLTVKGSALSDLGRGDEQPAVWAEAEAVARALGDPVVLSRALEPRVSGESLADRVDVPEALADEALHLATTAGDEWTVAMAAFGKMMAATTIADLRERTDQAASLLEEVGNVLFLANLLASAAYGAMGFGSDRDARELVERAVPIARRLDDPSLWMMVQGNLGLARLLTGDIERARDAFREELRLSRELVVHPFAYEGLSGLAAVAATRGNTDRAARLAGAADALHHGAPYAPVEDRLDAIFFEAARASCGADAWNAAADEGAALSFDDAIAFALQEPRA
jgi:hypothetical protein